MSQRNHFEESEQIAIVHWARIKRLALPFKGRLADYLVAIPNGGKRRIKEAQRLKAQGVKAGVSDMFLALPVPPYAGLWIELKPEPRNGKKNYPTQEQRDWTNKMNDVGYKAVTCWGVDETKDTIEKYLAGDL